MSEINQKKSTGRGGARPGSGRKLGSASKKSREIADRAAEEGITPLEVMLQAMREALETEGAAAAFQFARDAAPYLHPRISSTELTGKNGSSLLPPTTIIICGPDE